jgi:hypothetical protein
MNDTTLFYGTLPPAGQRPALPPSKASPAGVILHALAPLHDELDTALARNDRDGALRLAYGALGRVADTLAATRGDRLRPSQARIHALLVELEPLPFTLTPDGALAEQGTAVRVAYRNWTVRQEEADAWAARLSQQFATLWPGAWVVLAAPQGVR